MERISRVVFLKLARLSVRELDKLREAGVIQQAWLKGTDRQAKYFKVQALAIRAGKPVPSVDWPVRKSAAINAGR